jgi:hypothetical protein
LGKQDIQIGWVAFKPLGVSGMKIEEFEALVEPDKFRPFVVYTKSGWNISVPHSEFVDVPPGEGNGPSYVVIYEKVKGSSIPRLVDLLAIDHVEYEAPV